MLPWCPGRPPWCPRCSGALVLWPRSGFLVTWSCGALVFCYPGIIHPARVRGRVGDYMSPRVPDCRGTRSSRGPGDGTRRQGHQRTNHQGSQGSCRVPGCLGAKGPEGRTRAPFCKRHGTTRVLRDQGPRDPQGLFTGIQAAGGIGSLPQATPVMSPRLRQSRGRAMPCANLQSISGLVVEYIVAIDVTRVRFPADALFEFVCLVWVLSLLLLPFWPCPFVS